MKRFISILLMTAIFATMITVSVCAQIVPTINVSSETGVAGDTVKISISLENNPGIIAMRMDVNYDKNTLILMEVSDTSKLPGKNHSSDYTAYPYSLYWENATAPEDIVVNDVIATLTFKIKEDAPAGTYPIYVSYDNDNYDIFNYGLETVDFTVSPGNVTINPLEPEVKQYAIAVSDVQVDDKIALKATLSTPNTYADTLIFAIYDDNNKLIDVKLYDAAKSVNVSMAVGEATHGKLFWWNMETLEPYCECLPIEIK